MSGFKEIGYISAQTGVCAGLLADFRHANLPIFDKRSLQSMDCPEHRRVSVLLGITARQIANIIEYNVKISTQGTLSLQAPVSQSLLRRF